MTTRLRFYLRGRLFIETGEGLHVWLRYHGVHLYRHRTPRVGWVTFDSVPKDWR